MIDFIGIGAQKSGTSWVYACLYEHPQICAPVKEIHFFSRPRFEKGREWYESHFSRCGSGKLKGEFSTSYLYSAEASERIHSFYSEAKLIAIIRNPIDRAVSQYLNSIKSGEISESTSFDVFAAQEESVLEQGMYAAQLQRYFDRFPKEQLLVLVYEDIKKDPAAFMRTIYSFLGIDPDFESSMLYKEVNIARTPKHVGIERAMHHIAEFLRKHGLDRFVHWVRTTGLPDMVRRGNTKAKKEISYARAELVRTFAEDVRQTSRLLGRDLNAEWKIPYEA